MYCNIDILCMCVNENIFYSDIECNIEIVNILRFDSSIFVGLFCKLIYYVYFKSTFPV